MGNLLENFKTYILGTISSQIDSMNIKKKFEDEALTIFCSRCKKRLPLKNCPLNIVSLCSLCTKNHETDNCPSLLGLQAIYKGENEPTGQALQGAQKKPWKVRSQGIFSDPYSQFDSYAQWNQWQPMNNAPFLNKPWQQGWRGNLLYPQQPPL